MKADITLCQSCDKRYEDRVGDAPPNIQVVDLDGKQQ